LTGDHPGPRLAAFSRMKRSPLEVFTIGHSTRSAGEFLDLLRAHSIQVLYDVRRLPGSNRYPQFNADRLKRFLEKRGIQYRHVPGLGGRRRPRPDSHNDAWRNASFRGYADYMETDEFKRSLDRVISRAAHKRVALMCAEAVPWRCHRSLIADALIARGLSVYDIMTETRATPHHLPGWARLIRGHRLSYPKSAT
jgi:uncharacterized protein (DUF488 family)